ncbi:MAG: hypothetical protein C5B50_28060 [Verrucomicrobia bacterium]|nr:MAG: hypothetical protein C5B50_28060 [Verrucomicrobiota bacterium]
MFAVLSNHFDGVTRDQFERDLEEKNWVILLHKEDRLVGFSTMLAYETSFRGEPISVIYSGDTIVAEEARGSSALSSAWIASVNQLRKLYSNGRYYWLLLTSGFRTYRFLPVFWREFHPRFNAPTPLATKALMDYLALERFGGQYDPVSGIVRFTHPQRLKNGMAGIPDGRTQDAHIAFFAARNPGHVDGDELVCLTELTEANLTLAGRRMAFPNHPRLPCA